MEIETTLIGFACIALCVMPFILMNQSRKKREKQMIQALNILAVQEHGEISQHDICGDYLIALDEVRKLLFFQLNLEEGFKQEHVDLSLIKSCRIAQKNSGSGDNKGIEKLSLILTPKNNHNSEIVLEFYNRALRYTLTGELQSIKKWESMINEQLKKTS